MADNDNGVWLDLDTGEAVTTQPQRGRLLVAPGDEVTDNVQSLIDRYEDNYATIEQATAPDVPETRSADADTHVCDECGFEAKTAGGLASHQRSHEDG